MRALDDLVRQGHVRYVGVSNWPAWKVMKALGVAEQRGWTRLSTLQAYYTIAGRDLERELEPVMLAEGVGLLVWSPLAGGLLSGKYGRDGKGPQGSRRVAFNFPPNGWALCDGQILPIAQNTALFSLLGTTYGGNGVSTFALPDLRGRVPIHQGQGPGLSSRVMGEVGGEENHTLMANEMPAHTHLAQVPPRFSRTPQMPLSPSLIRHLWLHR